MLLLLVRIGPVVLFRIGSGIRRIGLAAGYVGSGRRGQEEQAASGDRRRPGEVDGGWSSRWSSDDVTVDVAGC